MKIERVGPLVAFAGCALTGSIAAGPSVAEAQVRTSSVNVHIESPVPATLRRRTGDSFDYMCDAPCDRSVEPSGNYFVLEGDFTSARFRLRDEKNVRVVLRPGNADHHATGIVLTAIGASSTTIGLLAFALGLGVQIPLGVPISLLALGVPTTVTGAVLVGTSWSYTRVEEVAVTPWIAAPSGVGGAPIVGVRGAF